MFQNKITSKLKLELPSHFWTSKLLFCFQFPSLTDFEIGPHLSFSFISDFILHLICSVIKNTIHWSKVLKFEPLRAKQQVFTLRGPDLPATSRFARSTTYLKRMNQMNFQPRLGRPRRSLWSAISRSRIGKTSNSLRDQQPITSASMSWGHMPNFSS